ncbi:hypothetical protein E1293_13425 [Actinomadura darangshiensis]|uniref:UGSC-like domain-containing protein n=1 Tax=Actinomadura darangshiensis TaxID=705336 RepID=A0A4R5BCF0_9ACTN|nr:hypothetical protein [Actinomadura darangshiensis]TDD84168.1 hypothetical protein E1293_13425 [Actinomadura darangshiensis]
MTVLDIVIPEPADPPADRVGRAPRRAPGPHDRLVLIDNGKPRAGALLTQIAADLRARLGFSGVVVHSKTSAAKPLTAEESARLAEGAGLMIAALGDCGACSACSANDAIQFERLGVPAVAVITEPFQSLVARFAVRLGLPDVGTSVLPHPVASRSDEELSAFARRVAGTVAAEFSGPAETPAG